MYRHRRPPPPLPAHPTAEDESKIDYVTFRTSQIKQILKRFQNKTSSVSDGIQEGAIPNQWKQANVVPIFKNGSSAVPKNYRPISLTCDGSKIVEAAIKTGIVPFLEGNNNLISQHQHLFTARHSTCLNLLESQNDLTENLDSRLDTFVAHVDFARAFNRPLVSRSRSSCIN
jgi:hypothetical protein